MISRLASRGKIVIDDGAAAALRKRREASCLPHQGHRERVHRGDMVTSSTSRVAA